MKHIKRFNEHQENSNMNDKDIPYEIKNEYDILMSRLRDGSADPDIDEVEDRIDEIRELYPNINLYNINIKKRK